MRVDVVYLVRTQSRLLQGAAHRTYQARAFRSRLGDMISITGGSVAHQFCENLCAAIPGEVQVFEDQHARTFAHDEAVARGIKGAARPLGIIIAARDGMHIIEGGHGDRSNALFGPASDHRPGITTANRLPRFSDRIGTGGAGRNNREVRPFAPVKIETMPGAPSTIIMLMKNGLMRSGPLKWSTSNWSCSVTSPPMPLPMYTPMSSPFSAVICKPA